MKDVNSTTWKKDLEIPTKAKTESGIIKAIKRYTDGFDSYDEKEFTDFLNSEFVTICNDGVIVWTDGE